MIRLCDMCDTPTYTHRRAASDEMVERVRHVTGNLRARDDHLCYMCELLDKTKRVQLLSDAETIKREVFITIQGVKKIFPDSLLAPPSDGSNKP